MTKKTDKSEVPVGLPTLVPSSWGELGSRLKAARTASKLSQQEMATRLGVSIGALKAYETGVSVPGGKPLQCYAALGFHPEWLLTGEGPMRRNGVPGERASLGALTGKEGDELAYVPYFRDVEASGGPGAIPSNEEAPEFLAFRRRWVIQELGARTEDLAVIRMTGESMEPTLRGGDVLLLDRRATTRQGDGIYVIRRRDRLQVKRLQFLTTKVRVTSDNPVYEPEELGEDTPELELIGRVVWVGRKL